MPPEPSTVDRSSSTERFFGFGGFQGEIGIPLLASSDTRWRMRVGPRFPFGIPLVVAFGIWGRGVGA